MTETQPIVRRTVAAQAAVYGCVAQAAAVQGQRRGGQFLAGSIDALFGIFIVVLSVELRH